MGSLVHLSFDTARRSSRLEAEHFWGPLFVLWVGSVARVALAIAHREVFQTEATLAVLCVMLIPLSAVHSRKHGRALERALEVEKPGATCVNLAAAKARRSKRVRGDFTTRDAM